MYFSIAMLNVGSPACTVALVQLSREKQKRKAAIVSCIYLSSEEAEVLFRGLYGIIYSCLIYIMD